MSLQQIIDDRISFLREQINLNNIKAEVNSTFQMQTEVMKKQVEEMKTRQI